MKLMIEEERFKEILKRAFAFEALQDDNVLEDCECYLYYDEAEQKYVENYFGKEFAKDKTMEDVVESYIKSFKFDTIMINCKEKSAKSAKSK